MIAYRVCRGTLWARRVADSGSITAQRAEQE